MYGATSQFGRLGAICLAYTLSWGVLAQASPVQWSGNGHYYEVVSPAPGPGWGEGLTWQEARTAAELLSYQGQQGYLATITSSGEQTFISSLISPLGGPGDANWHWIGGFQPAGSPEPNGNWQWVTGEPWNFTNWNAGEPNNILGGEEVVQIYGAADPLSILGQWNDGRGYIIQPHYIVEYAPEPTACMLLAISSVALLRRRRPRIRGHHESVGQSR